ncbi:MAG: hypothetical protein M1541_06030, partial [Acidobacteria bacterium]|nr:hypothetical protein [Acidobacteriota bacterium]
LPVQVPGLPQLQGGLQFVGTNGLPRGVKNPDDNNFAPRVGLAYKVTDKLVMRSGFGIFYNPLTGFGSGPTAVGSYTFNGITNVTSSIDGGRTPYTTLSNPYPDGYNAPTNGSLGLLSMLGQSVAGQAPFDRTPYSVQFNYDIQYEFSGNTLLDVAYVGNAGVKLPAQAALNQIPDADLALGSTLANKVANPFVGIAPATTALGKATTTYAQLLRPYPQFTGVSQQWGTMGHSSYNSLQVKLRKRYSNGMQFLVSYTWSKMIDDFSSTAGFLGIQNPGFTDNNNRRLDRSLSAMDVAHHLVFNYQYALPFGKGRQFLNHGGVLSAVVGGWNVNGVTTVQSGMPISITSAANTTNSMGGGQRPNSTGISTRSSGGVEDRIDNYFNEDAFALAPMYTFGNIGRMLPDNNGPYLFNWDLSLIKEIPIHEKIHLDLRGELFNAFNNVNFKKPAGTVFGLPQFGTLTATYDPRIIQVALKLTF